MLGLACAEVMQFMTSGALVCHLPEAAEPDGEAKGGVLEAALRVVADVEEPALRGDGAPARLPRPAHPVLQIPVAHKVWATTPGIDAHMLEHIIEHEQLLMQHHFSASVMISTYRHGSTTAQRHGQVLCDIPLNRVATA